MWIGGAFGCETLALLMLFRISLALITSWLQNFPQQCYFAPRWPQARAGLLWVGWFALWWAKYAILGELWWVKHGGAKNHRANLHWVKIIRRTVLIP